MPWLHGRRFTCRSLKPAQHAGQTLMRCKQDQMLPSQVSATHQPSFMSPATNAASLPRLLRVADHQGQLEDSSSPPRVSPDQDAEASIASSQPSTSGGSGSAGRAGRSLPQPAQYRGNAELVSYPLVESPEQSGPGRPARASASEAPKGRDGQPWAGRAAVPDSSSVKEHPAGPAASSSKMSAHQSSARSGPQSSSAQAEAEVLPDEEKSVQSSNREGGISSARGQPAKPGLPYQVMSSGIGIESVEWHSRIEKDWYAATVFVDLLTFIYVAVFYQVRSLSGCCPRGVATGSILCAWFFVSAAEDADWQPMPSLHACLLLACETSLTPLQLHVLRGIWGVFLLKR